MHALELNECATVRNGMRVRIGLLFARINFACDRSRLCGAQFSATKYVFMHTAQVLTKEFPQTFFHRSLQGHILHQTCGVGYHTLRCFIVSNGETADSND